MQQNPAEQLSEEGLAIQAASGDPRAFELLAKSWNRRIYNFSLRYLGDHDEAQEASQQTFIKAYQRIGSLQHGNQFRAWIYVIAGNTCRDAMRKTSRSPVQVLGELEEQAEPPAATYADENLVRQDMAKMLRKALAKLPEEQRLVLILKEYEGLKFTEIARILEEHESTVKSRLYSALKTMRKLLDHYKQDRI